MQNEGANWDPRIEALLAEGSLRKYVQMRACMSIIPELSSMALNQKINRKCKSLMACLAACIRMTFLNFELEGIVCD